MFVKAQNRTDLRQKVKTLFVTFFCDTAGRLQSCCSENEVKTRGLLADFFFLAAAVSDGGSEDTGAQMNAQCSDGVLNAN